jgi:hypothetical protein
MADRVAGWKPPSCRYKHPKLPKKRGRDETEVDLPEVPMEIRRIPFILGARPIFFF